jgi:hypothetical protein
MNRSRWLLRVVLTLVMSLNGQAFAQGDSAPTSRAVRECARAYETSQVQRGAGAISRARSEFERCRRADCPEFIRNDCSRWAEELLAEQPTVILSAKRGSRTLTQVRVSIGSRVLAEQLDDRAVELDPGEYDFRFETAEGGVAISHAVIQSGNKDRLVQVEFDALAREPDASSAVAPKAGDAGRASNQPSMTAPSEVARGSQVLPWVLLAVGTASVGTGVGLSIAGHSDELRLRETCSPHCTDAQVAPVHTKYLLSDISFGVGLVSLSAAAFLFLRQPSSEPRAEATAPIAVVASASGIQAAYGARF